MVKIVLIGTYEDTQLFCRNSRLYNPFYFKILGLSTHHMIHEANSSQQLYAKGLRELAPVLQRIATTSTRVIWLRQYPVIDFFGSSESHNTDIFSSKINQFNVESERILRYVI
jgi:hypothetical protein